MPNYQAIASPEATIYAVCSSCGHPLGTEDEELEAELTPVTAPAAIPLTVPATRFTPGTLLADRYRIVDILGSGGTGEVYRAQDLTLNQPVALKLFPHIDKDHAALERLHQEVRLARQISHGNVCRVFDIGDASGHPFITMEFVSGEDVHKLLRRIGHLSEAKALQVSRQLCAGLAAAHEAGVLHRDLKPANVMLDARGNVRITDFGLAVLAADPHELNAGTPGYMAPEQLAGQEATARSDIYALGLVVYELFTGRRAHDPRNASNLVRSTIRRSQTLTMPGIHPLIQQIVTRCLNVNAAERPASVVHVAAALSRAARLGAAVVSQPRQPITQPQEPPFLKLVWSVLGASLAGALFLLMLAPVSTGIGLSFGMNGPAGSLAQVFSWMWGIALQLLIILTAMAYLLRKRWQVEQPPPPHIEDPAYPGTLQ